MIGRIVTDTKTGEPLDGNGNKLATSNYSPLPEVMKLFSRVQLDYQSAWRLQHRPWDEFDDLSLLERARLDQQTFGAYVGATQDPKTKAWRWKGRKNTARNKIIGILAHILAGMLFPYVSAYNEEDEEDKMTARVMKILVENHLKKAGYEIKFMYLITSALVNPAVICEIEYVTAFQRIKQKLASGEIKIVEAVDDILSGINMNIIPIDQLLFADFYTNDVQRQPFLVRVRRISYDEARNIYSGKYKATINGEQKDPFDYVMAGKTRVIMAGQEHQTLYDIEWTEADYNFVQEITVYYRPEDLQVTFVGGVFMGNEEDIYNNNPFEHRRTSLIGDEWCTIPIYPFAKSGFEPLDPAGRFVYYKSASFKEFWDDAAQNRMWQLAYDGTYLDVIKPLFLSGVAKADGTVIVPGATVALPAGAQVVPYNLGPNLMAAMNMMNASKDDLAESTQDKIMSGVTTKGVTAYATAKAEQNARTFLGVFGLMVADLVRQIGDLTVDCIIQHTTVGEVDATVPEALRMKFKRIVDKGKENGKNITNRVEFTDATMGKDLSQEQLRKKEWALFNDNGGEDTDQRVYKVNPYKFARHKFGIYIDPDQIVSKSMGTEQMRKDRAFAILTNPMIAPFTDQEAVANDMIEDVTFDGDPDKFKKKGNAKEDMLNAIMGGQAGQGQQPQQQNQQVALSANQPQ